MWLSLVERYVRDVEAACSNHVTPTKKGCVRNEFHNEKWVPSGNNDDYVTYLPSNSALASSWNTKLAWKAGYVLGEEARGRGKDVVSTIRRSVSCTLHAKCFTQAATSFSCTPLIKGTARAAAVRNEFHNEKWVPSGNNDDYVTYLPSNDNRTVIPPLFPKDAIEKLFVLTTMRSVYPIISTHQRIRARKKF